jgi:hypothetical protein
MAEWYAQAVVQGAVVACRWERLGCQRFLHMLQEAKKPRSEFIFDADRANDPCAFIETLPHIKGFTEAADAATEAARLLTIYSARRDIWKFRVNVSGPQYRPQQGSADVFAPGLRMGSVISLQMSRFLKTPKPLVLIGRVDDAVADALEFSAWG